MNMHPSSNAVLDSAYAGDGSDIAISCTSNEQEGVASATSFPSFHDQAALEIEMAERGAQRFRVAVNKAREKDRQTTLAPVRKLLTEWLDPLAADILDFIEHWSEPRQGMRPIAHRCLMEIPLDNKEIANQAAYVTLTAVLNGISKERRPFQEISRSIGRALNDCRRVLLWKQHAPALLATIEKDLRGRNTTPSHRAKAIGILFNHLVKDKIDYRDWDRNETLHTGAQCLQMLINRSGGRLSVEQASTGRNQRPQMLVIDASLAQWITTAMSRAEAAAVEYLPMIIPPKPWTENIGGGYWTGVVKPLRIIRGAAGGRSIDAKELAGRECAALYPALNVLQDTAWQINPFVMEVALKLHGMGRTVGSLVTGGSLPELPERPHDADTNETVHKAWKAAKAKAHDARAGMVSSVLTTERIIDTAKRFSEYPTIYFPWTCDFRGRAYPVPGGLQPQGNDLARGLLRFAVGKPVDETAIGWLKVAAANAYGEADKASFEDRIAWVDERLDWIKACVSDPIGERWWTEADDPWQFLALVHEIARLCRADATVKPGDRSLSFVPVTLDGTCNGLQHLAALTRDEETAAKVNLIASPVPGDIYQEVANKVTALLLEISRDPTEKDQEIAAEILRDCSDIINRTATKHAVMTLCFGASFMSRSKSVDEWMTERQIMTYATDEERQTAKILLTKLIGQAIGQSLSKPQDAMKALGAAVKTAGWGGHSQVEIGFTTPDGFKVHCDYRETKGTPPIKVLGHYQFRLADHSSSLDMKTAQSTIAANVVASLDGTHMRRIAVACKEQGIESLTAIHDCFGTHAADIERISRIIREEFIKIYQCDVLMNIIEEIEELDNASAVKVKTLMGGFDIAKVREARYMFS